MCDSTNRLDTWRPGRDCCRQRRPRLRPRTLRTMRQWSAVHICTVDEAYAGDVVAEATRSPASIITAVARFLFLWRAQGVWCRHDCVHGCGQDCVLKCRMCGDATTTVV